MTSIDPKTNTSNVSIRDIQSEYFEILDTFFGHPFSEMRKHGVSPQDVAEQLASSEGMHKAFSREWPEFFGGIRDFWKEFGPTLNAHIKGLTGLKSFFGGDIFPSYTANIASSVGLYVDTILLPDPLLKLGGLAGSMDNRELLRLTAKHSLNALQYRDSHLPKSAPRLSS